MKLQISFVLICVLGFALAQFNPQMRMRGVQRPMQFQRRTPMRLPVARSRPMGPPRPSMPLRAPFQNNFGTGQMPGIRPPKGMVERLNRAKLKDFMALGQFLLHRRTVA